MGDGVMMDIPLTALRETCAAVAVSARPGSGAAARAIQLGLPCLQDDLEDAEGPLAGIRRGLIWAAVEGLDWLALAPCDALTVTAAHYRALASAVAQGASAAVAEGDAGMEPLISLWPVLAGLVQVDAALRGGDHPAIRRVLEMIDAVPIRLAGYDGLNVNAPADLVGFQSRS